MSSKTAYRCRSINKLDRMWLWIKDKRIINKTFASSLVSCHTYIRCIPYTTYKITWYNLHLTSHIFYLLHILYLISITLYIIFSSANCCKSTTLESDLKHSVCSLWATLLIFNNFIHIYPFCMYNTTNWEPAYSTNFSLLTAFKCNGRNF